MIKEKAKEYFLEGDYNCAESIILAARDTLGLDIPKDSFKLLSAFGGGLGCGKTCGAIAAASSIYGLTKVEGRAHEREEFKEEMAAFVGELEKLLDSTDCDDIKPRMFDEEVRCLKVVEAVSDALEEKLAY